MRALVLAALCLIPLPTVAQDSAPGRLTAFVTNRYLSDFGSVRLNITRLELLGACQDEELLPQLVGRILTEETNLKRKLIADVMAFPAEGLPDPDIRRDMTIHLLDAFGLVDATTRAMLIDQTFDVPPEKTCNAARETVLEYLESPQPTGQ